METKTPQTKNWILQAHELGKAFTEKAMEHDANGTFVHENYALLKSKGYFSALIPIELGGGGVSYSEMCNIIRVIGSYCGSTALAFSMHQHLVAAAVWKYKHKNEGARTLAKIAENQLVLVSTGAKDWLGSNGELTKLDGGYLFSAKKHFASQSVVGDIAVTSSIFKNPNGNNSVLHFSVPLKQKGVSLMDDWDVMGMRATGSQTIFFEEVFIPEDAIALIRKQNEFHPVWNIVLTVAMPLIMSAYMGIAQDAHEIAVKSTRQNRQQHSIYSIGQLHNTLLSGQAQWKAMLELTSNLDFRPSELHTANMLAYKTNVSDLAREVVSLAMEIVGGQSFYKLHRLERLFRDVQASQFHPLPKWNQYEFTGKQILGRE
ncbi:acyl-CoA dehydrogenase family protein [Ulvibacterium marinum]|uniref:acyl-CoA dehydrogenase family protein n=1 Tax=Ulvibacterium marinum TaxID=2419782 RepID=UPI0024953A8D|nr:acyl-CoA dehydrogenase family protein [Ulvibacterium marinum]